MFSDGLKLRRARATLRPGQALFAVRHVTQSILRPPADAEARNVSLLSCWPALDLAGFWERTLMPLLNFVVFTLYPAPLALRRDDASLGLAHGSFMMVRRDVYERMGGHALVRDEI